MHALFLDPKRSVFLALAAIAACTGSADNNQAADTNIVEANPEATAAAVPANTSVAANAAEPAPAAAAPAEHYEASGYEPGWALTIDQGRIDYRGNYGEKNINVARPEPEVRNDGRRYITERLIVDLANADCVSAEGSTYEHKVTVTADGETYTGCGGKKTADAD